HSYPTRRSTDLVDRQHRKAVSVRAELSQVRRSFLRRPEGNQIAESLVDCEEADPVTIGLGVMGTVQLVVAKPADEKMAVVDEGIRDAGCREIGGELRLPHALGEPQSGRVRAEALLQVLAHPADLLQPVLSRQRCENRLVESGEQQLE